MSDWPTGQFVGPDSVLTKSAPTDSLAIYVSEQFKMSGRLQQEFKKRYGGVEWLKNQGKTKGQMIAVPNEGRYIYYLIVKKYEYDRVQSADLRAALDAVTVHADANGVANIAFPQGSETYTEITDAMFETETAGAFAGKSVGKKNHKNKGKPWK